MGETEHRKKMLFYFEGKRSAKESEITFLKENGSIKKNTIHLVTYIYVQLLFFRGIGCEQLFGVGTWK